MVIKYSIADKGKSIIPTDARKPMGAGKNKMMMTCGDCHAFRTPDTFLCLYAYMMEFPALLHQDELRHHELVCGVPRRF